MTELDREELLEIKEEREFTLSSFYKILVLVGVAWFAFYVGDILFGKRSIEALLKVQKQEKALKKDIKEQKQENAKLQKTLFRYQVLSGQ